MSDEAERIRQVYTQRALNPELQARYRLSHPGQLFLVQQRERRLLGLLTRYGLMERLSGLRMLDVGCGTGDLLLDLIRYGARPEHLSGLDLMADRVSMAQVRLPTVALCVGDAASLPHPSQRFDIVFQMAMLSSVLDDQVRRQIAAELLRVCAVDGLIVWYDLARDSPRNPTVRGIGPAELARLFPGCRLAVERATLVAPLARLVAPRSWLAAQLLEGLWPLRTHLLAAIQPG